MSTTWPGSSLRDVNISSLQKCSCHGNTHLDCSGLKSSRTSENSGNCCPFGFGIAQREHHHLRCHSLYSYVYLSGLTALRCLFRWQRLLRGHGASRFSDDAQCLPDAQCRRFRWHYRAIGPHRQQTDLRDVFRGPNTDWIFSIAVAPDGSVWAGVSSFIASCINIQSQLIHLDASGSKLLADVPISPGEMVVDHAGNLYSLADGAISVSPGALLGGSCGGRAYVELSPSGQQLFATYLPSNDLGDFVGADVQGTPYLGTSSGVAQIVPSQPGSTAPYAGCVVDTAYFGTEDQGISPGVIP